MDSVASRRQNMLRRKSRILFGGWRYGNAGMPRVNAMVLPNMMAKSILWPRARLPVAMGNLEPPDDRCV